MRALRRHGGLTTAAARWVVQSIGVN